MKYIRTKEGIYEDAGTDALGLRCVRYKGHVIALSQDDDEIVKEADTIEELCDYALYEERGIQQVKKFPEECDLEFIRDLFLCGLVNNLKFAVLTNDGIINKAKMNAKGELELL